MVTSAIALGSFLRSSTMFAKAVVVKDMTTMQTIKKRTNIFLVFILKFSYRSSQLPGIVN